jgi:Mg2+/Co2+ transporter CorC
VVDEHGTLRGLVSIEDVLGDLFGEIGDELKPPESPPSPAAKEAR